jgi:hypothetical protein
LRLGPGENPFPERSLEHKKNEDPKQRLPPKPDGQKAARDRNGSKQQESRH